MEYLWIFLAALTAYVSGRNVIAWTIAAYFFGWVPFAIVAFLPKRSHIVEYRMSRINNWSESLVAKKEFGNYNNVDDLFKQLETR
jgi:hypothetical protein